MTFDLNILEQLGSGLTNTASTVGTGVGNVLERLGNVPGGPTDRAGRIGSAGEQLLRFGAALSEASAPRPFHEGPATFGAALGAASNALLAERRSIAERNLLATQIRDAERIGELRQLTSNAFLRAAIRSPRKQRSRGTRADCLRLETGRRRSPPVSDSRQRSSRKARSESFSRIGSGPLSRGTSSPSACLTAESRRRLLTTIS